ncbi:oxidoreductase [Elstera cyanobacteriorum]|uniref:Oxidoreductase n=1 Tax=Elstera cyanobacteriorum TaxID=2022747 RepID=A0A255XRM7_9PROT|nr:Gfo/Idh/MocA family oxidoreductase [Elstera cyanobacteriorum]OYQ19004.1 oxidoreductase [Elstera cyanobacteriorum]GFZ77501.1 oxidoreductase [Elstera cyanobacteriorum]
MEPIRFAAIGLDHNHIYGQTDMLIRAGAEFVSFYSDKDDLAAAYGARFPQARRVADVREILEDTSIALVTGAGIPDQRAADAIAAMRHGKDVLFDKPGMVSLDQLAEVKKVQAETGRIYAVYYSEHIETRCTVKAGELIADGAIGRVIHTAGFGPHRLGHNKRPDWFFDRARYGGILTDIAAHQFEQFLFFTGAEDAEVVGATVANLGHPATPGLQDFGETILKAPGCTGYIRVDWFTPDGLPTWGDGRLTILGTEGYIELRKYVDIGGQPETDHLFLVDQKGVKRIDCTHQHLPYGGQLLNDIRNRTETAMPQARTFKAMELALRAQAAAEGAAR